MLNPAIEKELLRQVGRLAVEQQLHRLPQLGNQEKSCCGLPGRLNPAT